MRIDTKTYQLQKQNSISQNYHFHKDCVYYENCIEKKDKVDGHKVIRFWCPKMSEILHQKTGKCIGHTINYGESYDRVGGYPHYLGDLHTRKVSCVCFEPVQTSLFEMFN